VGYEAQISKWMSDKPVAVWDSGFNFQRISAWSVFNSGAVWGRRASWFDSHRISNRCNDTYL